MSGRSQRTGMVPGGCRGPVCQTRRGAAAVLVLAVLLVLTAPSTGTARMLGYVKHSATVSYPRGQWVTLTTLPGGGTGAPVLHQLQAPVIADPPARWVQVRLMRMPARDGTGNTDLVVPPLRRVHVHAEHVIAAFVGRAVWQIRVPGQGTWTSPYRIGKALRW